MNRSLKPVAFVLSLAMLASAAPAFADSGGEAAGPADQQEQPFIPSLVYRAPAPVPNVTYRQADGGRFERQADRGRFERQGRADERAYRHPRGDAAEYRVRVGSRLPPAYHQPRYVVNDWQRRHLSPPPRGYQWVQTGADVALVAIATGLILQVLLNH